MTKQCPLAPLMLVGTGSDVGKSVLAAGFCRIFLQDGYHPAPWSWGGRKPYRPRPRAFPAIRI